ncbi:DNA-binding proteins Bright/BRCAA1/RBP1 and proteins containing BRIGHT domain, partial [Elasticomyces elasticus]
ARRLIVAALEGRVDTGTGGDPNDIIFEKVGWGRWDARRRGNAQGASPLSYSSSYDTRRDLSGTSSNGRNPSSDEDHDMFDADKMSLDDDEAGYQSSEAPPPDPMMDLDSGDETLEEDWESIGAEALRARSLPPGSLPKGAKKIYQPIGYTYGGPSMRGPPTFGNIGKSVPAPRPQLPMRSATITTTNQATPRFSSPNHDSQERAAIEALISMGSM